MKLRILTRICFLLLALVGFSLTASAQGTTTGALKGSITDSNGEPLIGATVTAIHQPTGTFYGTATDLSGNYQINNVKVGGPYKIEMAYVGYQTATYNGVMVRLGEAAKISAQMTDGSVEMDVVTVSARSGTTGENSGTSTQISAEDIALMPTLNRDLNDFTRLTPQSKGTFGGGFSIAGANNRFNAIYIDGAVNNDVFGLAQNGTNGGQTGIAPISMDAIDQVQVVVSPYDVTLGGFSGGGINAVTKSGTNDFKGTAYYFLQNENLAGKTNSTLTERTGNDAEKLDEFSNTLYGASLGGPLIKDKVFFFVNAEIENRETPVPFDFETYRGEATPEELNTLKSHVQDTYGYNVGDFGNIVDKLDGVRLFGKLDFNLNNTNKLTVRHQYTKAEQFNLNVSDNDEINFSNNGVFFPSTTNVTAVELNSQFGSKFSNNLIVGYTTVRDDRDPLDQNFPYVTIEDGEDGRIEFGSEQFSTANQLDQDIFTITNNFKMYAGDHTLTFGTHNEFFSIYNLFIRQNFGAYRFASMDDFMSGAPATEFDRSYSLVDELVGDGSAAAADFSAMQLGFYVQDEWAVSPQLSITGGVRLDVPIITDDPSGDADFQSTLDIIEENYDLEGARAGQAPSGQLMFSPRLGFNYDFGNATRTTLRGGLGIFTSRIPFVWPGGMFTNNGVTIGGVSERDLTGDINFEPNIDNQPTNPDFTVPSGQLDLFTENFKYPQVFRTNLAVDHELPYGIKGTIEGLYTKTLNNVDYQNVNSDPTVDFNWTGTPDDRPVFTRNRLDRTYSAIYLGRNTSEGFAYNFTASLSKNFNSGLQAMVAYAYGEAESINEGTSSQNSSQWRGAFNVDGRNNVPLGRSDFALGNRIIGSLGYKVDWNAGKNVSTTISLFYEGQSGDPYSYVYNGSAARNLNNEDGSTSRNRSLIWIPADASEINLVDDSQWEALNAFIEADDYLSANRGSYAIKNGARTPFTNQIDMRILQDFGTLLGGKMNKIQLSLDIFNVGNLINSSWGVRYSNPFDYRLINFEGYVADPATGDATTVPQFSFTDERTDLERFNIADLSSRWRMRLGVRYIFN